MSLDEVVFGQSKENYKIGVWFYLERFILMGGENDAPAELGWRGRCTHRGWVARIDIGLGLW